jgi:L-lactate utilization protein LutC
VSKSYEFIIHEGCWSCSPTTATATVAQRLDSATLLYHLSQQHPDQVGPYLERMRTECIATSAAEAFEVVAN